MDKDNLEHELVQKNKREREFMTQEEEIRREKSDYQKKILSLQNEMESMWKEQEEKEVRNG